MASTPKPVTLFALHAAEEVRRRRRALYWSQDEFAERMRSLGFHTWTRATVSEVERQNRHLTLDEVAGIARSLQLSIPIVLSGRRSLRSDRPAARAVTIDGMATGDDLAKALKGTLAALVVKLGLDDGDLDRSLLRVAQDAKENAELLDRPVEVGGTIGTGIGFDRERGLVAMPPESPTDDDPNEA